MWYHHDYDVLRSWKVSRCLWNEWFPCSATRLQNDLRRCQSQSRQCTESDTIWNRQTVVLGFFGRPSIDRFFGQAPLSRRVTHLSRGSCPPPRPFPSKPWFGWSCLQTPLSSVPQENAQLTNLKRSLNSSKESEILEINFSKIKTTADPRRIQIHDTYPLAPNRTKSN